eukprot:403205-Prymnesium_polylepis.1
MATLSVPTEPARSDDRRRRNGQVFAFDGVFNSKTMQSEVFAGAVEPQVAACLQGFNSTVFCYGPSGTGKSFTCYGPASIVVGGGGGGGSGGDKSVVPTVLPAEAGMIPRAAQHLFGAIERGGALQRNKFLLRVSFLQLYRESCSDLLASGGGGGGSGGSAPLGKPSLALREDPHRGVFVEGLSEIAVRTPQQMVALAMRGQKARHTAATRINDVSSRSHAIFTVIVEQTVATEPNSLPPSAPTSPK